MTGPLDINNVSSALGAFDSSRRPDTTQQSALSRGQQQGAEQYGTKLAADGQDPTYITRMELFEGITHEEIYTHAQDMKPGIMHHQADTWISIATALSGGLFGANLAIQKALASGIEGAMADAALAAAQTFYRQASDVEQVINACGHRIKGVASAAEVVKMTVPPPSAAQGSRGSATSLDPAQVIISAVGAGLAGAGDSEEVAYQRGIEALHRTAIDTMNNNYKPSYGPAGSGIPTFVPVTSPDGGGNEGVTGPGGGSGGGNGGGTTGSGTGNTGGNNGESNGSGTSGTDQGTVNPSGLDSNSTTGQQTQSPTTAASTTATSPAATTTTQTTSGHVGGLGTSGPGGTTGPGSSTTPSPGRSVTGVPTAGNSGAATASTAATSAAGTGRNGMSGMGSPGAGRKSGEDESSRKVPDYLIGQYEELVGPDDPAVPTAIGSDAPSAQPAQPSNVDRRG